MIPATFTYCFCIQTRPASRAEIRQNICRIVVTYLSAEVVLSMTVCSVQQHSPYICLSISKCDASNSDAYGTNAETSTAMPYDQCCINTVSKCCSPRYSTSIRSSTLTMCASSHIFTVVAKVKAISGSYTFSDA